MVTQGPTLLQPSPIRRVENPDLHRRTETASDDYQRPMDHRIFETWIETQLAPALSQGDVVILDNVGFHRRSGE